MTFVTTMSFNLPTPVAEKLKLNDLNVHRVSRRIQTLCPQSRSHIFPILSAGRRPTVPHEQTGTMAELPNIPQSPGYKTNPRKMLK